MNTQVHWTSTCRGCGYLIVRNWSLLHSESASDLNKCLNIPAALSWDTVQIDIPALDFVKKYENVFAFR